MAVAFGWINSTYGQASSHSISVAKGSNTITTGDLMVAVVSVLPSDFNTDPGAITKPSDWTQVFQSFVQSTDSNDAIRMGVFYKVAAAGESGSYTFGWTTNAVSSWALMDYTGTDTTTVTDSSTNTNYNGGYTTTFNAPATSPAQTNSMLLCFWSLSGSGSGSTPPASMNTRLQQALTLSGNPNVWVSDLQLSASGSTGTKTLTIAGTSDDLCWLGSWTILTASATPSFTLTQSVYQKTVSYTG